MAAGNIQCGVVIHAAAPARLFAKKRRRVLIVEQACIQSLAAIA